MQGRAQASTASLRLASVAQAPAVSSFGAAIGIVWPELIPREAKMAIEAFLAEDAQAQQQGFAEGASVSADIAAIKADTGAIKTDLETGSYSLQNILEAVQAIQNNAGFAVPVPAQLVIPSSGSTVYKVPVTVYDGRRCFRLMMNTMFI
jgi:hypothetical protein